MDFIILAFLVLNVILTISCLSTLSDFHDDFLDFNSVFEKTKRRFFRCGKK